MSLGIFLLIFTLFLLLGMPIAFSMIASSVIYAIFKGVDLGFLGMLMYSSINNFILLAIPFFLLTSEVMGSTTISKKLFRFAKSMVGFIPGGLGHVNILASIIFSGMSGSAVADAGGIGRLSYEAMVDEGYDEKFSMSLTAASAVIGPIIPPSLPMVVYAMVASVSVAKLFLGGIIPGLLLGIVLMIYTYLISKKRKYPVASKFDLKEIFYSFVQAILPIMTPVILLGGIFFGIVTITEASVLAVLYSCIIGVFAYHTLGFRDFFNSLKNVFSIFGPIIIMIPAAKIFGFVLTTENLPTILINILGNLPQNPIIILFFLNLVFIILGMISDPLVNIILFVPMFIPAVTASSINPVHFGVMIVLNTMIGLITPPVGSLLITVSAFGKVNFTTLTKEILPFIGTEFIILLAVTVFPQIVLWLPNLLYNH